MLLDSIQLAETEECRKSKITFNSLNIISYRFYRVSNKYIKDISNALRIVVQYTNELSDYFSVISSTGNINETHEQDNCY